MNDFYKYLPISKDDESWGISVLNVGYASVHANESYPLTSHPPKHYFKWSSWRTLQEYQLIYITRGSGVFESASFQQTKVQAGSMILLFPNEAHRYKPDLSTGWDEYWVGLSGSIIDGLVSNGHFSPQNALMFIGFREQVVVLYTDIIEKAKNEQPGYQPFISSAAFYLMGICYSLVKQQRLEEQGSLNIINKATLMFRSNIGKTYSAEHAAKELGIGYSSFRKLFKNHTGLSPGQYYLQLKIEKAKDMLCNTDLSIKMIAQYLNFESSYYFSKLFKDKVTMTPTDYRIGFRGHIK